MNRAAFAGFVLSVVLLAVSLPLETWMESVRDWVGGLGFWAPLAYAVAYGCATTLFVPGSALSVAAGVVFGLWKGSVVVWAGANLAIVTSFLIARHVARSRVEAMARTRPRFAALDRALGEEGWKIVALMRLSPLFPFSLQNYLLGVTAIRFRPYAVASGIFMIPGTFLYVYLGYAGGQVAAVAGGLPEEDIVRLVLRAVGLVATILVTVIVARIAARAIARHTPEASSDPIPAPDTGTLSPGKSAVVLAIACASLIASLFVFMERESVRTRLSPSTVQLDEATVIAKVRGKFGRGLLHGQHAMGASAVHPATYLVVPVASERPPSSQSVVRCALDDVRWLSTAPNHNAACHALCPA